MNISKERKEVETMKKYLIIECDELSDAYDCDAYRTPICLTDDFEKFNHYGYEIYEIQENGELNLIKDYEAGTF